MEELLNKLIEKGWKPFGKRNKLYAVEDGIYILGRIANDWNTYDLRQLVSKESWLWQFVCDREHRFIDKKNYEGVRLDKRLKNPYVDYDGVNTNYEWITSLDYQYRLIESCLKDESELEDFLLSNIKVEW